MPIHSAEPATPEQVLGTCLRLELDAAELYRRFQVATRNPGLARIWSEMRATERLHARTVGALAERRDLAVPAISRDLLESLVSRVDAISREADEPGLDDRRMVTLAAVLEFSEMDDLFAAVCRAGGIDPEPNRAEHFETLASALDVPGLNLDGAVRQLIRALIRVELGHPPQGPELHAP